MKVMNGSLRIAAVVVLYNPGPEVEENILTWASQVDVVYSVDNSALPLESGAELLAPIEHMICLQQRENVGIATALNIGAGKALEAGCDFLLTMDQDSQASPDMVARMLECLAIDDAAKVGMLSPFHVTKAGRRPPAKTCTEVITPMTSGCLLNLAAYRTVGPFRDDFFIDFVDNEYCLRLRKYGFKVLQANRARLDHSVGDIKKYGPFIATNHSSLRRYYKTRNRFCVFREYLFDFPGHCLFDMVRFAKEIGSIVLFEGEKVAKLTMMWRGWQDFWQGKFGKYGG